MPIFCQTKISNIHILSNSQVALTQVLKGHALKFNVFVNKRLKNIRILTDRKEINLHFAFLTKAISNKILSLQDVQSRPKKITLIKTVKFSMYKSHLHSTARCLQISPKNSYFVYFLFYSLWVPKIHLVLTLKEENIMEQRKKKSRTSVVYSQKSFQFLEPNKVGL